MCPVYPKIRFLGVQEFSELLPKFLKVSARGGSNLKNHKIWCTVCVKISAKNEEKPCSTSVESNTPELNSKAEFRAPDPPHYNGVWAKSDP